MPKRMCQKQCTREDLLRSLMWTVTPPRASSKKHKKTGGKPEMRKAAFFDRDGTINVDIGYLYRPKDLAFVPGTPELIRKHNLQGELVIVITNQSGIARGYYTQEDMHRLHKVMNQRLHDEYGAHIDAFYFCPHLPEITGPCECRKPAPGLFERAIRDFGIDPAISVSYGDSKRDEEASRAAGIGECIYVHASNRSKG